MTDQLAKNSSGVSVDDLKNIAVSMQRYVETENDETVQQIAVVMQKNSGFWSRMFPTQLQKEQNRAVSERVRALYKSKEQFFKLYTDVQLEIARKQGDALIATVGMDLQAKLAAFATQKIEELTETIDESRSRFLQRMRPALDEVETYNDIPDLHEPALQSVKEEINIYFKSISKLLNGFVSALESKVAGSKK
jgi:hypothetical protein